MYLKFNAKMYLQVFFLIFYQFISKLTSNILPCKASNFSNSIFNSKLHPLKLIIFWTSFCGFQRIYSSNSSLRYDSYQTLDSTNLQPVNSCDHNVHNYVQTYIHMLVSNGHHMKEQMKLFVNTSVTHTLLLTWQCSQQ